MHDHSDVIKGLVPTLSDIRVDAILPGQLPGKLSLGLRAILI